MSVTLARLAGVRVYRPIAALCQVRCMSGESGSGAGRGGGTGGSIRDAGGSFGKMEAAHEDQYFRQIQAEQFSNLKEHHDDEIDYHSREILRHKKEMKRLQKRLKELETIDGKKKADDTDSD